MKDCELELESASPVKLTMLFLRTIAKHKKF